MDDTSLHTTSTEEKMPEAAPDLEKKQGDNEAPEEAELAKKAEEQENSKTECEVSEFNPLNVVPEKTPPIAGAANDKPGVWKNTLFLLKTNRGIVLLLAIAVVVAVVLAVVLTREDEEETDPPLAIDFTTGVSLATYYGINATISSRLARTVLTMEVANALNCSSIHGITLQSPLGARIASLTATSSTGCDTYGQVLELEEARDTFVDTASQGLPGAYVEERDSFTHSLQVALPPLGTTRVELVIEEILRQRVGQVEFQIPLVPNEEVDHVELEVTIVDFPENNDTDFFLDLSPFNQFNATTSFHLDIPDAREHELPRVFRGFYDPGDLPDSGIINVDGTCFEHFFLPTTLEPMPKQLFFLLDVSRSNHLQHMKTALKTLIDTLTPLDTLTIQAFAGRGTEQFWGSAHATDSEKIAAKNFVDRIYSHCCESNLHEGYLEALLRANAAASRATTASSVTLLVLLSDRWASAGVTDRPRIARDVWNLNREGLVKLFTLAFPNSDHDLLNAIAIMNGGVSTPIVDGTVDFVSQMQSFFESEFGHVLLSDVNVQFMGTTQVVGATQSVFPLLAEGTEVVVRGLLSSAPTNDFQARTTARSSGGGESWIAVADLTPAEVSDDIPTSLCFQSYAHSRITQLMQLRDAAVLLGDEVVRPVVSLVEPCTESLVDCIEAEALSLALEAKVVAQGLTGLVTVDEEQCLSYEEETEICLDGTAGGGYWDGGNGEYGTGESSGGGGGFSGSSGGGSSSTAGGGDGSYGASAAPPGSSQGNRGSVSGSPRSFHIMWVFVAFCILAATEMLV